MNTRTLYLIDDNRDFVDATRFWLEAAGWEVRSWTDPADGIAALCGRDRRRPACLLLDIRMPGLSGLDVQDALIRADAMLPTVIMSGHANVPLAVQAMRKGAVTVLEKPFEETELAEALEGAFAVASGACRPAPSPATADPGTDRPAVPANATGESVSPEDLAARERFRAREGRLSPREREVLSYAIEGVYNKNIAERIGLSIKTVELYRSRGMAKMQARSIAELTRMMVSRRA